jgi:hypothetical protein
VFNVPNVSATTITFEGAANTIYGAPITRSDLEIGNPTGQEQHFHEIDSTGFPTFVPNDGTGVLYNDRDTQIFFRTASGAPFSLFAPVMVDVATDLNGGAGGANSISIAGFVGGVQTTPALVYAISGSYLSIDLTALGAVDQVLFDGASTGNGGFTLDNFAFREGATPVPEPATLSLLGMGISAMALRRRKQAGR